MHTDWSLFFGRFHPLIVHIPIGIILFAALLNVVERYRKSVLLDAAINIALLAGAVGAGLAAFSGYFLSSAGGYNSNTLFWHQWIGIVAAILILITWLIRKNKKADIHVLKINLSSWLLFACIVLIAIGGHLGGKMAHGEGYLTKYMPPFLKSIFVSKKQPESKKILPSLDSVVAFKDIIQPILNAKCTSCHNSDKSKGELDLTTSETIIKGGKSGNTIVAGDLEKSELYHRITLSPESSKYMPADSRTPLTPIETGFIKWWIENGADYKKNITSTEVDEKTKYLIAAYLGIDAGNNKEIRLPEVEPADSVMVRQLSAMKIIVRPLTSQSNLLEVSFVMLQSADAAQIVSMLEKLSAIKKQLYRLDVSNCRLTKDAIKIIAAFGNLTKLELQKNNLTDEAIEPLSELRQLVVLNAGQNMLTDKSISTFKKITSLKKINLWQTQVTDDGAKDLQTQLHAIVIER
ncbi:MAG: c-type cytochrome domain-containing protein [Bacteroidota bacterium]